MSEKEMLSFRVDVEIMERLAAMAETLKKIDEFSWGQVNRSSVARLALQRGLATLEKKYSPTSRGKKRR